MEFQFKQFSVLQNKSAMKVGTDGVLLGAWASLENSPQTILDIGTGTGLIALMLAQRSTALQIDAIEINGIAYEECVQNFENSAWSNRLFCYHTSLAEFTTEIEDTFDLIVSNPPFFPAVNSFKGSEKISAIRKQARYTDSLSFEDLVFSVSKLLSKEGEFATVIPYGEENSFLCLAEKGGLFPRRITRVKGMKHTPVKRSLIQFSRCRKPIDKKELVIEVSRHHYTEEYKQLTSDFYLDL